MKNRLINTTLWLAYLLALAASLGHVAATFNRFERPDAQYGGWLAAVAVDLGLAALAYAIQQRKRARRSVRSLWAGVMIFAAISGYANVLHALSVSPATPFAAIAFSATLPGLVVLLGEIVSSDDAAQADAIEREQRRLERLSEREATQGDAGGTPKVAVAMPPTLAVAAPVFACEHCDARFENRFALSAHARAHKNGHKAPVADHAL